MVSSPCRLIVGILLVPLCQLTAAAPHCGPRAAEVARGDGRWVSFTHFVSTVDTGVNMSDMYDGKALRALDAASIQWLVLIGDSNTRYTFYELIRAFCSPLDALCEYAKPLASNQVKKVGKPAKLTLNDNGRDKNIMHSDQDLVVMSGGFTLWISFRMSFGAINEIVEAIHDFEVQHCRDAAKEERCNSGMKPKLQNKPMNKLHPDFVFVAEGLWKFSTILSQNTDPLFAELVKVSFYSNVIWVNQFEMHFNIMTKARVLRFTQEYGLEMGKTVVGLTNLDREMKAKSSNFLILNVSNIGKSMQTFYDAYFGDQENNTRETFQKYVSPDGVHQSRPVYLAVMQLMIQTMLACKT